MIENRIKEIYECEWCYGQFCNPIKRYDLRLFPAGNDKTYDRVFIP